LRHCPDGLLQDSGNFQPFGDPCRAFVLQMPKRWVSEIGNTGNRSSEMKKFALALALTATTAGAAFAGGPAVVGGEPEVVVAPPATGSVGSGAILGVVGGLALLALLASGSSSSTTTN
jgi:hypothetical protein